MILWTIQPLKIYDLVQRDRVYRCAPSLFSMPEFVKQYDWLVEKKGGKIGPPPTGVKYPVWAWHKQNGKMKKPDLRTERWSYGPGDEDYTCIEIEIPDNAVVLSDFDIWHIVLNNGLISASEEEDEAQYSYYETLNDAQKEAYKRRNWERVFDIGPIHNGWVSRGDWVQATFWEMKREDIRKVQFFRTGKLKEQPSLPRTQSRNEA